MASGIVESSNQGSNRDQQQQQQQQSPGSISRSKLVQRLLASGSNLPAFLNDLVYVQAAHVAGTEAAAFVLERPAVGPAGGGGDGETQLPVAAFQLKPIAHIRPDESDQQTRTAALQAFQEIVRPCIQQGKDGAIEVGPGGGDNSEPQFCLVTLLRNEGEVVAASAVITRCRDVERAHQRLMSMQLVAGYFDLFTLRRQAEQSRQIAQSHQHVLQLAGAVGTSDGFEAGAMNLCNELATRTGATRVSLGWVKGERIRVRALSHTEQFDKKQELIVGLEKVMEECLDQEEIVHFSPDGEGTQNVTRDAAALSRAQAGNTVLSLPLRHQDEVVGVMTLEFAPGTKLSPQAATGLAVAADVLAPQLYDRYQNDRYLITKAAISTRETAKLAIGPKHMLAKLLIVLGIGAVLALFLYHPTYHVQADFAFEPVEKRYMPAPFEGQIEAVYARPGDEVVAGQELFKLRTYDLEMQLLEAQAEAGRYAAEAQAAQHGSDRTNGQADMAAARIADESRKQAEARIKYIQAQIDKATVTAPFDGQVLQGDLTQRINAPVKLGDDLMEIGNRESLKVQLNVADRDIQSVSVGQAGSVATKSLPGERWPITVERIVPQPQAAEGDNVYTVYATLDERSAQWLPGMKGEARLDAGHRSLAWILSHRLLEWVELKTWGWPVIGG